MDFATELTPKQLKAILKENLQNSGRIQEIKAKLRKDFIQELSKGNSRKKPVPEEVTSIDRILLSLIFLFLQKKQYFNTISVFLAECPYGNEKSLLLESELIKIFDHEWISNEIKGKEISYSLLEILVSFFLGKVRAVHKDESTQTNSCGPSPQELLQLQLQELEKSNSSRHDDERDASFKSIESRLFQYQRDLESRKEMEMEIFKSNFTEVEAMKIREEENEKFRSKIESLTKELEFHYHSKLQKFMEKEQESAEKMREQERRFERSMYEQRNHLMKQLEDLRLKESSLQRRGELESQGLKFLEIKLKEFETKLLIRSNELDEREKTIELKYSKTTDQIKSELSREFKLEMSAVQSEKADLIEQKRTFLQERLRFRESCDSLESTKNALKSTQKQLEEMQQANEVLRKEIVSLKALSQETNINLNQVVNTTFPNLLNLNPAEKVSELIKTIFALEAQIAQLADAKSLKEQLDTAAQDLKAISAQYNESKLNWNAEKSHLTEENRKLKSENISLQAKSKALDFQLLELKQLLQDKERNIKLLQDEKLRGVTQVPRGPIRPRAFFDRIDDDFSSRWYGPSVGTDISRSNRDDLTSFTTNYLISHEAFQQAKPTARDILSAVNGKERSGSQSGSQRINISDLKDIDTSFKKQINESQYNIQDNGMLLSNDAMTHSLGEFALKNNLVEEFNNPDLEEKNTFYRLNEQRRELEKERFRANENDGERKIMQSVKVHDLEREMEEEILRNRRREEEEELVKERARRRALVEAEEQEYERERARRRAKEEEEDHHRVLEQAHRRAKEEVNELEKQRALQETEKRQVELERAKLKETEEAQEREREQERARRRAKEEEEERQREQERARRRAKEEEEERQREQERARRRAKEEEEERQREQERARRRAEEEEEERQREQEHSKRNKKIESKMEEMDAAASNDQKIEGSHAFYDSKTEEEKKERDSEEEARKLKESEEAEIQAARARVLARRSQQRKSFNIPELSSQPVSIVTENTSSPDQPKHDILAVPVGKNQDIKPTKVQGSNSARPRFDFGSSDSDEDNHLDVGDNEESGLAGW